MSINAKERVVMAVRGSHSISPTGLSYYLQHKGKVFQIVILLVFLLWQLQGTSEISLLWGGIRELAWMIVDEGRGGEGETCDSSESSQENDCLFNLHLLQAGL